MQVANNLFWHNPIDILEVDAGTPTRMPNVFPVNAFSNGMSPAFINEEKGNYNIDCGRSLYIDRGIEANYGRYDFAGHRRVQGMAVDFGAMECGNGK